MYEKQILLGAVSSFIFGLAIKNPTVTLQPTICKATVKPQ